MKISRDPVEMLADPAERAVAIGAFDGVHLGHQAVLRLVRDLAHARGLRATVLTFDRHPAEIVRPESAPKLLTTLEQKLELLDATGAVEECAVLTFDVARSKEPAEQFVEELLASALHARLVVVGSDFHFGFRRHGDVPLLQRMGAELGFETIGLGLVAPADAAPYSSTRVRTLLAAGDIEGANAILGRPHEVRGPARRDGARVTVQVPERICVPAAGEYAGTITDAGATEDAIVAIGRAAAPSTEPGRTLVDLRVGDTETDGAAGARVRFLGPLA